MLDSKYEHQALLLNAPAGAVCIKSGTIRWYNNKFAKLFDLETSLVGQPASVLFPLATEHGTAYRQAESTLAAGHWFHGDFEFRRADHPAIWLDLLAYPQNPESPDDGSIWILCDVTERKLAEQANRATLLELQTIFDSASVGIAFMNNRNVLRSNPRFAEMMGYADGELHDREAVELHESPASYELLRQQSIPLLSAGLPFNGPVRLRKKDGALIWCHLFGRTIDPADSNRGTVWIAEDISESVAAREALQKSLREMEALMANASVGIAITRERKLVRYNQRFGELFGFSGDSGIGAPSAVLYRSAEEFEALNKQAAPYLLQGKPFKTELYMRRQDGSDAWMNLIGYVADTGDPAQGIFWIVEDRSAYKLAEEELRKAYVDQRLIFDHCVVGIAFIRQRVFEHCNRRLEELYGYPPGGMTGQPTRVTFFSDEAYARLGAACYDTLARGETFVSEVVHRRLNGDPIWMKITGRAIDPQRPDDGSIWNFEDITSRKLAEDSLRESVMLQRAILDSAKLMILTTDTLGRIASCNPATEQMLGFVPAELLGNSPADWFMLESEIRLRESLSPWDVEDHPATATDRLLKRVRLGQVDHGEWTFRRKDGSTLAVELSITPLQGEDKHAKGFLFVASDITERKRAEHTLLRSRDELELRVKERTTELESEVLERRRIEGKLRYLAHHDALTGLANRTLLQQRLGEAMDMAAEEDSKVALLFIDLDRFKTINDSLGHHIGDTLLKSVATRLTETLRASDTVARLGGDEFMIVLPINGNESIAGRLATKILDALRPAIRIDGHELFVTPSIGICFYPDDGLTVNTLMRNADTAMYQAKANGRNNYCYFTAEMNAAADNYFQIESDLRRAVERDEFVVHYQPVIDLKSHEVTAYEALVRWKHPTKGLLGPAHFISVAEESGLIGDIGSIVLRKGCAQIRRWLNAGYSPPSLALNLSTIQFNDPNLIDGICRTLHDYGLTPDCLELEITETVIMQDGELALGTLQELSDRGFRLSIDDFGTGYSSLAYLKRFPVDTLKIDRSFITDMTTDDNDHAIVTAIMALASSLRLKVVAEGVETEAQFAALSALNCNFAQGYLMARPMPAEAIDLGVSLLAPA